jgi:hypothetical protein
MPLSNDRRHRENDSGGARLSNRLTVAPRRFMANIGVNWTVAPGLGTMSSGGQYTTPVPIVNGPRVVLVTATSQSDATKFATALITLGAGTPTDLHLTNLTILSGSPTYRARHAITADTNVSIGGTATVTFSAGSTITLSDGFRATVPASGTGTTFHAVIQ